VAYRDIHLNVSAVEGENRLSGVFAFSGWSARVGMES
jgi:hypothetical protein